MPSSEPRAFLGWLFAGLLLFLAGVLALTAAVDPSGLLQPTFGLTGPCASGVSLDDRKSKPYLSLVHLPREILVGNSKVQLGFSQADVDAHLASPVVNLAVSAATFDEMAALGEDAMAEGGVRRLWIGLDVGSFVDEQHGGNTTPRRAPLSAQAAALRHGLFDSSVMRAALGLLAKGRCDTPIYTPRGFRWDRGGGAHDRYLKPHLKRFDDLLATPRTVYARLNAASPSVRLERYRSRMGRLTRLLAEAERRDVAVVLFINPAHASQFAAQREAGFEPLQRRWRVEIAALVAAQTDPNITLLDFTDDPPSRASRAGACAITPGPDCLYYDSMHYVPSVGRRIIEAGLRAQAQPPAR
jgi:hypothetical protein